MRTSRFSRSFAALLCAALLTAPAATAQDDLSALDLVALSLEELLDVEIVLTSRKEQPLFDASAAAFVLTADDIRRAGVTSLPDALRLVPGAQVARIDANKWAISIRGFNGQFANKLLVLIDGRTAYTPMFSGVFWDVQDLLLEDVERIEVVRGPGAALWGVNAVNGIINVVTSHSSRSPGSLVSLTGGTEERGQVGLRHAASPAENFSYRIYAKYFDRDPAVAATGQDAADDWAVFRAGFRCDWDLSPEDALTLQGTFYDGETGQTYRIPASLSPPHRRVFANRTSIGGGHLLGRWQRDLSATSDVALQLYYDRTERRDSAYGLETRDTFDADAQHWLALGGSQELVWGLAYRLTADDTEDSFFASLEPDDRAEQQASAFVHDDLSLLADRFVLTLGTKVEWKTDVGLVFQPNLRLRWKPGPRHVLWSAVSRALRTPSRFDKDGRINADILPADSLFTGAPATLVSILGDRDLRSEELLAFELGYRVRPIDCLFADVAAFYNRYDDLNTLELGTLVDSTAAAQPHLIGPLLIANKMSGSTRGVEISLDWRPRTWWRLWAAYSYIHVNLELDTDSRDLDLSAPLARVNPPHQFVHRSSLDLPGRFELDWTVRHVDRLPLYDIPAYTELDARLGWSPRPALIFALVGRDLLDARHPEFKPDLEEIIHTQVQRSLRATVRWEF